MSEDKSEAAPPSPPRERDWHELAEKASHEMDPKRLIDLVQRLCHVLDEERTVRSSLHSNTASKNCAPGASSK